MYDKIEIFLIGCKMKTNKLIRDFKERIIDEDEGSIEQVILGIVIFAVLAILVYNTIGDSIKGKSNEAAKIINDGKLN